MIDTLFVGLQLSIHWDNYPYVAILLAAQNDHLYMQSLVYV